MPLPANDITDYRDWLLARTQRVQRGPRSGGVDGDERLTTVTGALLLVLFAAEGVTILSVHRLLGLQFFLGMLLAGPVALKIGITCYRFARYYAGAPAYVRQGLPPVLLRLLGPVVELTSCGVIGTGIALARMAPGAGRRTAGAAGSAAERRGLLAAAPGGGLILAASTVHPAGAWPG